MADLKACPIAGAARVAAGKGPGPRNVLVRLCGGKLVVIPPGRWRFKRKEKSG